MNLFAVCYEHFALVVLADTEDEARREAHTETGFDAALPRVHRLDPVLALPRVFAVEIHAPEGEPPHLMFTARTNPDVAATDTAPAWFEALKGADASIHVCTCDDDAEGDWDDDDGPLDDDDNEEPAN